MNIRLLYAILAAGFICLSGCTQEKKSKDRGNATDMFERICKLTKEYTEKVEQAEDSASWAAACIDFEDRLDKISFSYPPDTDLLLTEGQNDTIHDLMQEYVKSRDGRIHEILRPVVELDSLTVTDSVPVEIPESHE
ncbi:MAG: hypothetical protein K2N48_00975 [Muribaculaceae bacterium]|nr:hypothetical protein [Muribaculaceae bacterium]